MLARLTLDNFRNIETLDWKPGTGTNLILGRNGAGKTSLLEAIYLAATTRSFRTSHIDDCRRVGSPGFRLDLATGESGRSLLHFSWWDGRRRRDVNGTELPLTEHLVQQPLVLWTAEEKLLLTGPPSIGRRVLDRGIVSQRPENLITLGRYRRALKQKRLYLQSGRDRQVLASWNQILSESGELITQERRTYVEAINTQLGALMEDLDLGLPLPKVQYRGYNATALGRGSSLATELEELCDRELAARRPLVGPHRDQLQFLWGDRELKKVGSAGELKAIGLLLVAAQGRILDAVNRTPLFLLDDIDTELDRGRLEAVWQAFGRTSQVVATSSRPADWLPESTASTWWMRSGKLSLTSHP